MAIFGKFFYAFAMFIMLAKLTQASPRPGTVLVLIIKNYLKYQLYNINNNLLKQD